MSDFWFLNKSGNHDGHGNGCSWLTGVNVTKSCLFWLKIYAEKLIIALAVKNSHF
jgi:hypothetical protein